LKKVRILVRCDLYFNPCKQFLSRGSPVSNRHGSPAIVPVV
jgi:hypothetical protein